MSKLYQTYFSIMIFILMLLTVAGCGGGGAYQSVKYTLIIDTVGEGSVNPASGGKYDKGAVVNLDPQASPGWIFERWEGQHGSSVVDNKITMDEDKNITALFTKLRYSLNITKVGNGTISEQLLAKSKEAYDHDSVVRLTAIADPGWVFDHWEGDLSGSNNPETLVVDQEKNITAVFVERHYTVSVNVRGNGHVTKFPDAEYYTYNSRIKLTAIPDIGWVFSRWESDESGFRNPKEITTCDDRTLTAVFIPVGPIPLNTDFLGLEADAEWTYRGWSVLSDNTCSE